MSLFLINFTMFPTKVYINRNADDRIQAKESHTPPSVAYNAYLSLEKNENNSYTLFSVSLNTFLYLMNTFRVQ